MSCRGARRVVRHLLLPDRQPLLRAARRSRGHALQHWAARFGFGAPTGIDIGPRGGGPRPDARVARADFRERTRDRTWKPGDSIQLAIGQGDLAVTPLQMARFYAMLANGGQLVTPHLAEDVERPRATRLAARRAAAVRAARRRPSTGVDPGRARDRPRRPLAATHAPYGTSSGVFGTYPVRYRRKTGHGREARHAPRLSDAPAEDQSWWCGYGPADNADDRRLRRDRERRPRLHRGRPGSAEGLRAVTSRGEAPSHPSLVGPTDRSKPSTRVPAGSRPAARGSRPIAVVGGLDWILLGAVASLVAYGLWVDRRHHALTSPATHCSRGRRSARRAGVVVFASRRCDPARSCAATGADLRRDARR